MSPPSRRTRRFRFARGRDDETPLSTEPAQKKTPSRLPRAQSDESGPEGAGRPPRQGPEKTLGLRDIEKYQENQLDGAEKAPIVISTLTRRSDFIALRHAHKTSTASFLMAARKNTAAGDGVRVGITVTKKLGGAVARNRIKRRLRAAIREVFPQLGEAGTDYVLIAREAAIDRNFTALLDDMKRALLRLSRKAI